MIKKKIPNEGRGWGQVQIGTSSLVLIFTVLCLVVFSTLSIASAKVDQKLAEKNQQYVTDYYIGDGKAEEMLKEINDNLVGYGDSYQPETQIIDYKVDLNQEQFLFVELELFSNMENQESKKKYVIRKWVVQNKVDYEIDEDLQVWDGSSIE